LTVNGTFRDAVQSRSDTAIAGALSDRYKRAWFEFRGPMGQDISATLSTTAGNSLSTDHIQLQLTETGVYRG
jgi:hypothetical protein